MADIFISYARSSGQSFIETLASALQAAGYSVWWDREISVGAEFAAKIEHELEAAKAVIVVWSEAANKSTWVKDEAGVALAQSKFVPACLGVEPPLGFRQFQAHNFARWDGDSRAPEFISLTRSIADIVGRVPIDVGPPPLWHWLKLQRLKSKLAKPHLLAAMVAFLALTIAVVALVIPNIGPERQSNTAISKNAVAVLPFDNVGESSGYYLSEGLSDELRDALMHVRDLHVLAPASSRAFRNLPLEASKIAERLKVGQLIEGSFRQEAGRLRVSVQIVDGLTGFQTWAKTFEVPASDILKLQQEVAVAVAIALTGRAGAFRELSSPPSLNLTAYDAMLLAHNYEQEVRNVQVVDKAKLGRAIDLYRFATTTDPKSALAHSRLAGALLYAGKAEDAEVEIKRAVALNPNLSEVQYTLALYYSARGVPGVGRAYQQAVTLNPNNADALSGLAHWNWTNSSKPLQTAEEMFRRAVELDPMSLRRYMELGSFYGVTGQRDKVIALTKEIASRFPNSHGLSVNAEILVHTGDYDLAIASAKSALKLAPQEKDIQWQLADLYAQLGDFKTAARYEPSPGLSQLFWRRDYKRLVDLAEEVALDQPEDPQIWYFLGFGYAAEGHYENAIRVLKIAGLPERARAELGVGEDTVALSTLAGALKETGAPDESHEQAQYLARVSKRFVDTGADQGVWSNTMLSCALAMLHKDDAAMAAFAHVNAGPELPRLPWLKDLLCFKRFANDERYLSVIRAAESRQADVRRRVAVLRP